MGNGSVNDKFTAAPSKNNHPTVKPLDLMEYLITMVTPKNGTVLEPFMGSGTTGVAAVNLNCNFIGIELDKDYFAIDKLQGNEREVVGITPAGKGIASGGSYVGQEYAGEHNITKGTSEWEGWGTALKPAHEPICMARKPLSEKTVAENCLKWGTGGINIDESRVATYDKMSYSSSKKQGVTQFGTGTTEQSYLGRFPANIIHDNSEEVRECFPDTKPTANVRHNKTKTGSNGIYNEYEAQDSFGFADEGSAARFFKSIIYQAKASKSERNKGCEGLEDRKISGIS